MINSPIHSLAFIGNFGGGEIILIFLIILLLFGAKKVPELFRSLGKGVTEFRKAKNDWEQDISEVMNQEPVYVVRTLSSILEGIGDTSLQAWMPLLVNSSSVPKE